MPHEIDETLFENWQRTFASRIGRPQLPHAQVADYRAFCRIFASDQEFHDAAQHVYEHWASWNAWPAPIEFEHARALLRRQPDAEVRATQQLLAAANAIPAPKPETVAAFGQMWRAELADAEPETAA